MPTKKGTKKPSIVAKLNPKDIKSSLKGVSGWKKKGSQITRSFEFKDFNGSMKFVGKVAKRAEKMDHHPDILIEYNKVTLALSSHDVKGLSGRDFKLAGEINTLL